jgi:hypothetical protein
MLTHRHMVRAGWAWVGVSAQRVGIEGGGDVFSSAAETGDQSPLMALPALKASDPARYGGLHHPGDVFCFDIFTQAARAVRQGEVLGPLPVECQGPDGVQLRTDGHAPVLTVQTETDVTGALAGVTARQADTGRLRWWEIAGAAHADTYLLGAAFSDSGSLPPAELARQLAPTADVFGRRFPAPVNSGPQHHYVAQAGLAHLDRWARGGPPPPRSPRLETDPGDPMRLVTDDAGIARGGIRTGWVDVPVAALSGLAPRRGARVRRHPRHDPGVRRGRAEAPLPGRPVRVRCRVRDGHVAGRSAGLRAGRGRRGDGRRGRCRIPGLGAPATPDPVRSG